MSISDSERSPTAEAARDRFFWGEPQMELISADGGGVLKCGRAAVVK